MGKQSNIKKIYVHHSASPKKSTDASRIRRWHIDRGWNDIGYHWVIEHDGKIAKGRQETTIGAHVKGKNRNSIGICVCGNFEIEQPNPIQWTLLCCMLQYLMYKYKLTKDDISYHREAAATACPGKNLISKLKEWREE
jgi:N-acetylmuramoyl-L-alanine amidase